MVIKFKCSGCGKGYKIRDDQAGERIECPECATLMKVPKAGTGRKSKSSAQTTPGDSQAKKTTTRGSEVKKKKKSAGDEKQKRLLIGAGITGAVLLMGGLIFLLLPAEDVADASSENSVAAVSPTPDGEPAPAADMASNTPAGSAAPQASQGVPPVIQKAAPGFKRYTGGQLEIPLPGVIEDLVPGGGGRYLVMYLKEQRQIAIYDVNEVQIVKTIPLETEDALIAAGADDFLIADRSKMMLERWSFNSFEKEAEAPLPEQSILHAMSLGFASRGPLLLSVEYRIDNRRSHTLQFMSLETLQHDPEIAAASFKNLQSLEEMVLRASGDGKVFGILSPEYNGDILGVINLNLKPRETYFRKIDKEHSRYSASRYAMPNADGSVVQTDAGLYSLQLFPRNMSPHRELHLVPSTHPNYFVTYPLTSSSVDVYLTETGESISPLKVGPLGNISDIFRRTRDNPNPRKLKDLLPMEKRVHYIPQADQVVTVPYTDDGLRIVPFSLTNELRKSNKPYLFASSVAPHSCFRELKLDYQLEVESSSQSITYELSAGPKGMTLSETGRLEWQVPETFEDKFVYVILTLNSADKQTAFQAFRMYVHDKSEARALQRKSVPSALPSRSAAEPVVGMKKEPVKPVEKPVAKAEPDKPKAPVVAKAEPEKKVEMAPMAMDRYYAVQDSLQKISYAFQNYQQMVGGFMPDPKIYKHYYDEQGRLKVSWRVHLLPYLDEQLLYYRFKPEEPWDSPVNLAAAKYMPEIYRSPETPEDSNRTRFRGFEKMGGAAPEEKPAPPVKGRRNRSSGSVVPSIFTVGSTGKIRDIRDGLSNTVLLVEAGPDQAVEWTKPGELDLQSPSKAIGTVPEGVPVAFADSRVRLLKTDIDDQLWQKMIHPADQGEVKIDELAFKIPIKLSTPDMDYPYLHIISKALSRFHSSNRSYPPISDQLKDGKPLLSWRVHLLPALGANTLYEQFKLDEPWNSPHNMKLLKLMPDVYECKGVTRAGETSIMTFTGPGTPFTGGRGLSLRDVKDGLGYTILFVQAGPDKAVPWTKPEDLPLNAKDPVKSLGRLSGDHFPAALMNGEIREIKTDLPAEKLKNLINHEDEQIIGPF